MTTETCAKCGRTKDKTCANCGHEKKHHRNNKCSFPFFYHTKRMGMTINSDNYPKGCSCKKFVPKCNHVFQTLQTPPKAIEKCPICEPKNHSPQDKPSVVPEKNTEGTQNQPEFNFMEEVNKINNIFKIFIRKEEDLMNQYILGEITWNEFVEKREKLAGAAFSGGLGE